MHNELVQKDHCFPPDNSISWCHSWAITTFTHKALPCKDKFACKVQQQAISQWYQIYTYHSRSYMSSTYPMICIKSFLLKLLQLLDLDTTEWPSKHSNLNRVEVCRRMWFVWPWRSSLSTKTAAGRQKNRKCWPMRNRTRAISIERGMVECICYVSTWREFELGC